jgi:hypothetical protein
MKYRGKTHNSILTEYGVFNSLVLILAKNNFLYYNLPLEKSPFYYNLPVI